MLVSWLENRKERKNRRELEEERGGRRKEEGRFCWKSEEEPANRSTSAANARLLCIEDSSTWLSSDRLELCTADTFFGDTEVGALRIEAEGVGDFWGMAMF